LSGAVDFDPAVDFLKAHPEAKDDTEQKQNQLSIQAVA
jgi:hypothetical protein